MHSTTNPLTALQGQSTVVVFAGPDASKLPKDAKPGKRD